MEEKMVKIDEAFSVKRKRLEKNIINVHIIHKESGIQFFFKWKPKSARYGENEIEFCGKVFPSGGKLKGAIAAVKDSINAQLKIEARNKNFNTLSRKSRNKDRSNKIFNDLAEYIERSYEKIDDDITEGFGYETGYEFYTWLDEEWT